ncbi:MAG TPA: hypothetical protein VJB16_00645, partial [archaeon]|nr:hypothetical protein [archaeon]
AAALIMDDSISSGSGTLSLRQTLRRTGIPGEDIVISAILDHVGITQGLCLLANYPHGERQPTADEQFRKLQRSFALYRSWHHADMEPRPSFTERLLFKPFGSLSAFRARDVIEVFRMRY